jgi:hypothetical protein
LKAARDKAQAEANELRQQLEGRAEEPPGPRDVEPQEQAQEQEWHPQDQQEQPAEDYAKWAADRDQVLQETRAYNVRAEIFKSHNPDFDDVLAGVSDVPLPQHVISQIRKSPVGPVIAYALGKDLDGLQMLFDLQSMSAIESAKVIAKAETILEMGARQAQANRGQPRARTMTQARPPIQPLKGAAGPTRQVDELAESENVGDYARMRRSQEAARRD